MRERLGKFALSLHPEKTRLIEFGRFAAERRKRRGLGKPETFNFLGFTFICGKTRAGKFQIKRKTRRDRMRAKLRMIKEELWQRTLRRRSHKDRATWERMTQMADAWLPKPTILHPWPSDRYAVTHPRWEPYARKTHVRFCAGGVR